MLRGLLLMVIILIRRVHAPRDRASRPRPECSCMPLHSPLLLLPLYELIHRIIILDIDMHLLDNELLISLPLFLGKALLPEAIDTHEDPRILELILLLLNVVLALHNGEVEDLALISLVTMEGRDARTYLLDLHTIG